MFRIRNKIKYGEKSPFLKVIKMKEPKKYEQEKLFCFRTTDDMHKKVKVAASKKGMSIKDFLRKIVLEALEKED